MDICYRQLNELNVETSEWILAQALSICQCKISNDYLHGTGVNEGFGLPSAQSVWVSHKNQHPGELTKNELVAFVFLQDRHEKKLSYLYLDVICALGGHNYGTNLLKTVIQHYQKEQKYAFIELRAFEKLIPFYEKFGFVLGSALSPRHRLLFPKERRLDGLHMTLYLQKEKPKLKTFRKSLVFKKKKPDQPQVSMSSFRKLISFCQDQEARFF